MKSIQEIAIHSPHKLLHKLEHYFQYYDRFFSKYRGTPVRVLEIGVFQGGSLDLWREYFGPDAYLCGVDIDPSCLQHKGPNTDVILLDQEDRTALEAHFSSKEPFDIIIDDGGHTMNQQIRSFEALFPILKPDGVYLVEDLQTSYWKQFKGGLRSPTTFIEFAKSLIDYVNIDHFREVDRLELYPPLKTALETQLIELTFVDAMAFFVKGDKREKLCYRYLGNGVVSSPEHLKAIY